MSGCTQQQTQTQTPTKATVLATLSKGEAVTSMSYNITGSMNTTSFSTEILGMNVWSKKPYFKEQITTITFGISTTTTIIQRPEGTYFYNTLTKKYVQTTNISSLVTVLKYLDPTMIKDLLNNQTVTYFPTQVIDGKQTTLVNLTVGMLNNQSIVLSVWIWNDMGVPLKAIITMNVEVRMVFSFLFRNYSFADILDSTFDIS